MQGTSMLLSNPLCPIHHHLLSHDIQTILTIPYEHSRFPKVPLLILSELDGTYLFISCLNSGPKFLDSGRSYSGAGFDFQRDLVRW